MKKLLWLDDMRDPFLGDWLMSYAPEFDENRENIYCLLTKTSQHG